MSQSWYAINRKQDSDEAEVSIYDAIGAWGVRAAEFCDQLKSISATRINVRLNTPGGEVFDATAIYNALREHPARVVVHIDGVAASAGSFIAMAGDEVRMADNAYLMIHNARGGVMGESEDMRKYAEVLDKCNENIAGMYEKKTGKERAHWRGLMDAETWFTASEAEAEGLVDAVYHAEPKPDKKKARAAFDFTVYNCAKIPDAVKELWGIEPWDIKPSDIPNHTYTGIARNETNQSTEPPAATEVVVPAAQVPSQENTAMPETSSTATTAQASAAVNPGNPAGDTVASLTAQTIQSYQNAARAEGRKLQREDDKTRLRELIAAAPGKSDIAIQAFLADETPASVKIAFEAAANAERNAQATIEAMRLENLRLLQLNATGGYPNGVGMAVTNGDESDKMLVPQGTDPETQAKMEWDSNFRNCRNTGATEKQYILARKSELAGIVRTYKGGSGVTTV